MIANSPSPRLFAPLMVAPASAAAAAAAAAASKYCSSCRSPVLASGHPVDTVPTIGLNVKVRRPPSCLEVS